MSDNPLDNNVIRSEWAMKRILRDVAYSDLLKDYFTENRDKLIIARKMLSKGMSVEEVSDITGLNPEEILDVMRYKSTILPPPWAVIL